MIQKIIKNEEGVSLVEVLGALVILSIILIGFFTMFTQTSSMQNVTEDDIKATNLMNIVINDVKDLSLSTDDIGNYNSFDNLPSVQSDGTLTSNDQFYVEIMITEEPQSTNLLKATIKLFNENDQQLTKTYAYVEVDNND
ncbi:type II secretory pathway component PulJ [Alkalibacillus flavidus]|uniref:Type II secretory pathway component PulJ n=1 Tax=Alkalibacillus flavidus TaxID=546021 RepID=A0ABV2KX36_9BACI